MDIIEKLAVLAITVVHFASGYQNCALINGDMTNICKCTTTTIAQCKIFSSDSSSKTYYLNVSSIVAKGIYSKYGMMNNPPGGLEMYVSLNKLTVPGMGDSFVDSVGGYLKNNGGTIKTVHLIFSNLPNLDAGLFSSELPSMCEPRRSNQSFNVRIDNMFDNSESPFQLNSIINCATNIEIFNIPLPLVVESSLNLLEVKSLTLKNTTTYYDITPILFSSDLNSFNWEADNFFPEFYQTSKESQFYTNVSLMGSNKSTYLHKEVFFHTGSINLIQLSGYIDRIEYGTFALPGKIKQFFCNNATDNPNCTEMESLFLEGECSSLEQNLCEICYMHQYGFHRTMDNVKAKCSNKEPVQYSMMTCFWREIQPIPQSMKNLSIDSSWLNTDVKPCRSFPFDIAMFIRAIRSASRSPDLIPEGSTVTTHQ